MKYTNTSKTLSLVFHAILFLAFGAMGVYFGGFVVPGFLNTNVVYQSFKEGLNLISNSYIMYLELAVLGLAIASMSGVGLYKAIKSLNGGDKDVVDSFASFIAEGWIIAIFLFLNGSVLFGMISGESNVAFTIIIMIVFAIMALIATNIPMVKLFDGKDSKPLISNLCLAGAITGGVLALETILTMVFCNYTLNQSSKPDVLLQLALLAGMGIVICAASAVVLSNTKKGGSKIDTALIGGAGLISGGIFVALGVLAAIWKDDAVNLIANPAGSNLTGVLPASWALGFIIMIIAVGVAIMGAGCAAFVFGGKKK